MVLRLIGPQGKVLPLIAGSDPFRIDIAIKCAYKNRVNIEFDPAKSETNRAERGFGFEQAVAFDFETALFWIDDRFDYPEQRWSALGLVEGRVHALVFTETASGIRVISFRKANDREVTRYEQAR